MFTESGEIGTTATKASTLFEKELCESIKQTIQTNNFGLFQEKKKLYTIINVILYLNYLRKSLTY